jgi:hypothetical protein
MDGGGIIFIPLPEILDCSEDGRSFVLCPATGFEV